MQKFHISTLGCQMNQADSLKLSAGLEALGWQTAENERDSSLVVINTCSVRQHAEDRAYSHLGRLRKQKESGLKIQIAVMGCMVGPKTDELSKRFPYVDAWARPQEFDPILQLAESISEAPEGELGILSSILNRDISRTYARPEGVSAFIPVVHGCDKFCTYCIVPLRRGRERSRGVEDIMHEIKWLADRDIKEVTLLGQPVEAYGHDLPDSPTLATLFEEIENINGIKRVRFLTSYPKDMTDEIISSVAQSSKVCEHFNIPVQSGSNSMLERMRRGYMVEDFENRVEKIRTLMPNASIATDVIVGCPGETQSEFQETVDLLEKINFNTIHVAAYSPRPGTYADRKMDDDIPKEIKKERLQIIEAIHAESSGNINSLAVGNQVEVLVETLAGHQGMGRTRGGVIVHFAPNGEKIAPGELVLVEITSATPWSLKGHVANTLSLAVI